MKRKLQWYLCLSTQSSGTHWYQSAPGKKRGHIQIKVIWGKSSERDFAKYRWALGKPQGQCSFQGSDNWGWWGGGAAMGSRRPELCRKICDPTRGSPWHQLSDLTPFFFPMFPWAPWAWSKGPKEPLRWSTRVCLWGHWVGWAWAGKWIWREKGQAPSPEADKASECLLTLSVFQISSVGYFCVYIDP